jgi:hypothetical protein
MLINNINKYLNCINIFIKYIYINNKCQQEKDQLKVQITFQ